MTKRQLAIVGVVVLLPVAFGLSRAGVALRVSDPLQRADAIVVIGGKVPYRAMKAADLYEQRLAPEIWLTMGNPTTVEFEMDRPGNYPTQEHTYSQMVLERQGVPANAIHVIPGRNTNTASEVKTIAGFARQRKAARVILVTSSYHSRRLRTLWRKLVGSSPEAIVQYTDAERFNARRWFADTRDARRVLREWVGLLNAWLGFR